MIDENETAVTNKEKAEIMAKAFVKINSILSTNNLSEEVRR